MSNRLVLPAEEVTGMLRQGAEAVVYQKSPEGHFHGKRIKLLSVTIDYELQSVRESLGSSGYLIVLPKDPPKKDWDPNSSLDPAGGC